MPTRRADGQRGTARDRRRSPHSSQRRPGGYVLLTPGDISEREHSGSHSDAAGEGAPTAGYGPRPASRARAVRPMTRLFGITVAGGLSSENRVFARLLSERGDRYDALVVVHDESGAEAVIADHFAGLAKTPTVPIDTGWRPNRWTHRGNPGRAPVALRYRRRLDRIIAAADGFEPGAVYSSQQHYDCRAASKVARSLAVPQIVHLHYTVGPVAPACRAQPAADHRSGGRGQRLRPRTGAQARRARAPGHDHPQHDAPLRSAGRRRGAGSSAPSSVCPRTSTSSGSSAGSTRVRAISTPSPPSSASPVSATTCRWCSWVRAGSNTRSVPGPADLRPRTASS